MRQHILEDFCGMFGRESRNLRSQDVAQHARLLFETQQVTVARREDRATGFPLNAAFVCVVCEDGCPSAIAEETSADEDASVVVKEERGAADFDANAEDMLAAAGIEQGVSGCEIRQGCATTLANEIKI